MKKPWFGEGKVQNSCSDPTACIVGVFLKTSGLSRADGNQNRSLVKRNTDVPGTAYLALPQTAALEWQLGRSVPAPKPQFPQSVKWTCPFLCTLRRNKKPYRQQFWTHKPRAILLANVMYSLYKLITEIKYTNSKHIEPLKQSSQSEHSLYPPLRWQCRPQQGAPMPCSSPPSWSSSLPKGGPYSDFFSVVQFVPLHVQDTESEALILVCSLSIMHVWFTQTVVWGSLLCLWLYSIPQKVRLYIQLLISPWCWRQGFKSFPVVCCWEHPTSRAYVTSVWRTSFWWAR